MCVLYQYPLKIESKPFVTIWAQDILHVKGGISDCIAIHLKKKKEKSKNIFKMNQISK